MAEAAVAGAVLGFFFLFLIIPILIVVIAILALIFWIFMIVDVAQRKFTNENDRLLWILIVVLVGIIGALIYYFMIKRPNKH